MDRSQSTAFEITPDKIVIAVNPHKRPVLSLLFYLLVLVTSAGLFFAFVDIMPFGLFYFLPVAFYAAIRVIFFTLGPKVIIDRYKKTVNTGPWPAPAFAFSDIERLELLPAPLRPRKKSRFYYALTLRDSSRKIQPVIISAEFVPAWNEQPAVERELIPAVRRMIFGDHSTRLKISQFDATY